MKVAILGGTGKFGCALAKRLVAAGDEVAIGSRIAERAEAAAARLGTRGGLNAQVAGFGDLVVLAVPADVALDTVREIGGLFAAPVLSVGSRLEFAAGTARPLPDTRSLAERISESVDVPVAAGLHTIAARRLDRDEPPDDDAFVCGNDADATARALELAGHVVAGRAIHAGPLQVARALEGLAAMLLNLNRAYKTHTGLRVTGLP